MNTPYEEIAPLDQVYLEDSYVLGLEEDGDLSFLVDAVLTESSPHYSAPKPDEQYCYAKVRLTFPRVREMVWHRREFQPVTSPDGSVDYGNIDTFVRVGPDRYRLDGEWGDVEVWSDPPVLEYIETSSTEEPG